MCFLTFQIYFIPVTVEKYMNQCMYEMFAAPFSLQLMRSVKARMSEMEEREKATMMDVHRSSISAVQEVETQPDQNLNVRCRTVPCVVITYVVLLPPNDYFKVCFNFCSNLNYFR